MASLTKKVINGCTYWYLRETAWVDGRSKVVKTVYLGTAEQVASSLGKGTTPLQVVPGAPVFEFGAVMALHDLAMRLGIQEIIDRHVPKRGRGLSVGTLIVLAAINRAIAPTSKAGIAKWYERTSLSRELKLKPGQLTSQRFWDNMDRIPPKAITAIEREFAEKVVGEYELDVRCLFYDATNFFTFIDTFNTRATMAQRGKSKEGRSSLRILGLALLVTGDFEIPLFHRLYPGNHNDPTSFRSLVDELVDRYRLLARGTEDLTIVFDKGNNTEDTIQAIASKYHVVGSLSQIQHSDLLDIPRTKFRRLDETRFPDEVTAFRTSKEVFGRDFTILVTYNENLFNAQVATVAHEIGKRQEKLREYQRTLERWQGTSMRRGRRPTIASVAKAVKAILRGQHMNGLFETTVTEAENGIPVLEYRLDRAALERLQERRLGKTLLFTDNAHWSDEDIVSAYRGQHHVESAFRQMKDTHHVSFRPAHHWTDQKLQVHAFTCVLALTMCSLLRCELERKGTTVTIDRMLESLETIREVQVLLSSGRGRPRVRTTHSQLDAEAERLFVSLDLGRYLPT
jgi:transposase